MGVKENIIMETAEAAEGKTVADVRLGLGYTSVLLDSGEMGLAYTWNFQPKTECTVFKTMRPLAGKPAGTVIGLLNSEDLLAVSIGLATANAALNNREQTYVDGDLVDTMNLKEDDTVAMIGAFMPVVKALKSRVATLRVFERNENLADNFFPADDAFRYLPRSTVALVTSTSIINGTIDSLLAACGSCREVVMLGASTPLNREVFTGTPVSALSGSVVSDRDGVARVISEGGGMKVFKTYVNKVTLRI